MPGTWKSPIFAGRSLPRFNGSISVSSLRRAALLPFISRSLHDFVTGLVLLAFCGALTWWLLDLERRQSPAAKIGFVQAQAALGAGRLDEAIGIMEKLSFARDGMLSREEKNVRNQAYYKRAKAFADKGDYKRAVADLLSISPDFADYAESREKVAEYSKLGDAQAKPGRKEGRSKRSAATLSTVTSDSAGAAGTTSADATAVVAQEARPASEQTVEASEPASDRDSLPRASYTDAEQVRYHKLLEGYFSASRAPAAHTPEWMSAEDNGGAGAEKGEPPTLQEWLKQGKPDF
jgi:hypothetical protein